MRDDIARLRTRLGMVLRGRDIDDTEWQRLRSELHVNDIPESYFLQCAQGESREYLERWVHSALTGGDVTGETLQAFHRRAAMLALPAEVSSEMKARLLHGHRLAVVRAGNLPTAEIDGIILDADEHCHLYVPCHYERRLQSRVASMAGHLVLTNKKFRFVSSGDGWELAWNKILDAVPDADRTIALHASQRRGSGRYFVKDAEYVATVIATLTRMAKRQLVGRPDVVDTAVVPPHVKAAVFRRDQGRCQECGSNSYLEFDHIIPRSRGGATSENNLQLLCRRCNQAKGSRI